MPDDFNLFSLSPFSYTAVVTIETIKEGISHGKEYKIRNPVPTFTPPWSKVVTITIQRGIKPVTKTNNILFKVFFIPNMCLLSEHLGFKFNATHKGRRQERGAMTSKKPMSLERETKL